MNLTSVSSVLGDTSADVLTSQTWTDRRDSAHSGERGTHPLDVET